MGTRLKGRYTVLVVDDDPSVLATYGRLLRRAGYNTVTEGDPTRLLVNGRAESGVDLLLLDQKMPGLDGLSLLAELRNRRCRARCVLVSAYLNDDLKTQAEHLGVDRILNKPVDAHDLCRAIDDLLPANGRP
jgi:CheY-like chemotaxis protein